MGIYALMGGDAFQETSQAIDRDILTRMPPGLGPIVLLLVSADAPEGRIATGVNYFRQLKTSIPIEGASLSTAADAKDRAIAARVASAGMVVLLGENPMQMTQLLRGSEVLAAIAAVSIRGGIVAGANAGAMALGEWMRWHEGWESGLGLLPGVVVIPMHGQQPRTLQSVRSGLPESFVVLGIPDGTVSLITNVGTVREGTVLGRHSMTLYRANAATLVAPETIFTLPVVA